MSVAQYQDLGPVAATMQVNVEGLRGKSVVITGGANGLGKAYVKAFLDAGAFVTIGDYDAITGQSIKEEFGSNCRFVKCDVRNWDDQVKLFEVASSSSPDRSIDVVVANAGIVGADDLGSFQDTTKPPVKPDLSIIEVNLIGTAYTAKLAMHFFRRQPLGERRDRCLIIKGSVAAYADQPGSPQYNISKWGARGLFRNLRRTAWRENIRVNFVAPWYVRTPILRAKVIEYLVNKGVKFASVEDCVKAVMKISCDMEVNGRSFAIVPREEFAEGYVDLDHDDYKEADFLRDWQEIVLQTAESIVNV